MNDVSPLLAVMLDMDGDTRILAVALRVSDSKSMQESPFILEH